MTKQQRLADLRRRMEEDKSLPLRFGATQLVFGDGNPDSEIYLIGEAPGYHEDKQGKPFVGQAGKLLDETLRQIGIDRSEVYISNIIRFRPPGNRDPEPGEIAAFQPYVDEEISIIDPKIIVTLGRFSMGKFIPQAKISLIHGQARYLTWHGRRLIVVPMFHPAAALRSEEVMQKFKADFKKLPSSLKADDQGEENGRSEESGDDSPKKPEQLGLLKYP